MAAQYLYTLRPTRIAMLAEGPDEREARVVGEHFARLQRLCEAGVVLMAGRTLTTDERTFGIVVLVAESEAAARELMEQDPAVAGGVMSAELHPYRVALWARESPLADR